MNRAERRRAARQAHQENEPRVALARPPGETIAALIGREIDGDPHRLIMALMVVGHMTNGGRSADDGTWPFAGSQGEQARQLLAWCDEVADAPESEREFTLDMLRSVPPIGDG